MSTDLATIDHSQRAHSSVGGSSAKRVAEHRRRPEELSAAELRSWVSYDPETGLFTWIRSNSNRVSVGSRAGCLDTYTGYVRFQIEGRLYHAHRVAWAYFFGYWPEFYIDHRDTDKANNRIKNLRPAMSRSLNNANRAKRRAGLKGVTQHKSGRYVAQCGAGPRYLGIYDTEEEAHAVYCRVAVERFGAHARFE